jgi:hypothetical protein
MSFQTEMSFGDANDDSHPSLELSMVLGAYVSGGNFDDLGSLLASIKTGGVSGPGCNGCNLVQLTGHGAARFKWKVPIVEHALEFNIENSFLFEAHGSKSSLFLKSEIDFGEEASFLTMSSGSSQ